MSRRMGQNKALMPFLGQPLITRIFDRLKPAADEVILTTNSPEDFEFLGVKMVLDDLPGTGALGGLYTALKAASHPLVAVAACDMPFASADLLRAQMEILLREEYDAAVPCWKDQLEPMHAVYRRDACLPQLLRALDAGERKVTSVVANLNLYCITYDELLAADPYGLAFSNVNTPVEFKQAENLAKALESKSA